MFEKKATAGIKNMTQGSPIQILLVFALPLMAGNICQQLYTVTDTAIVGRAIGVGALAALGTMEWMNWLFLGLVQGITQGFSILIAQHFGAEDYGKLRRSIGNSIILSGICALVLLVSAQLFLGPAFAIVDAPKEVIPIAEQYLRILFAGIPIIMVYNMYSSILRALGDSKTPLLAMIIASCVNIALDLLFVLVFHWGVAGAAIATVLAQLVSAIYCVRKVRKIKAIHMERSDYHLEKGMGKELVVLATPMAFQNAVIAVGAMIVQMIVNGHGVNFIAGYTATSKLYGILEVAAISYGYAMVTYAGQNMGAGKPKRISKGLQAGLLISMVTSVLITTIMLVFGREILSCFISGESSDGQAALKVGLQFLHIMSLCLPILYVLHIVRSCIQGMGNTVIPMISGVAEFVMRTAAALCLPILLGENGILFAEVIAWTGADLVLIPGYLYCRRRLSTQFLN